MYNIFLAPREIILLNPIIKTKNLHRTGNFSISLGCAKNEQENINLVTLSLLFFLCHKARDIIPFIVHMYVINLVTIIPFIFHMS